MSDCQDHDAFTAQLVAVQRRLYAYILTALPNLQDADDVLQETNAALCGVENRLPPARNLRLGMPSGLFSGPGLPQATTTRARPPPFCRRRLLAKLGQRGQWAMGKP